MNANLPNVGERVRVRGTDITGIVKHVADGLPVGVLPDGESVIGDHYYYPCDLLPASKTAAEIDALKASWLKDPCWDIEDTPEFEAHRDELVAFHQEQKLRWSQAWAQSLIDAIDHTHALHGVLGMTEDSNAALEACLGNLILRNRVNVIAALKSYTGKE